MLKIVFTSLARTFTDDTQLINKMWEEIENAYAHKSRHYHTTEHLNSLLTQLGEVSADTQNWNAVLFSMFYHDIVYNVLKSNNEQKSAQLAKKRMKAISVDTPTIELCEQIILATASHSLSSHTDINIFTDADLSVLGQSWEVYTTYCNNVRKEYSIYPDAIYNPGRKKVLTHFLAMEHIYKTEHFFSQYEAVARKNMQQELELL